MATFGTLSDRLTETFKNLRTKGKLSASDVDGTAREIRRVWPIDRHRKYTADEIEFIMAMERYKRLMHRPFPTWHEVLGVLKALGYRKVKPPAKREPRPHSE